MSISSEISRIAQNVADSLDAVAAKGVTVPTGSTSDDLPDLIAQITGGGGTTYVTLFDEDMQVASGSPGWAVYSYYLTPFLANQTYRITFEGVQYTCETQSESQGFTYDGYFVGNAGLAGGTDTGEPFIIYRENFGDPDPTHIQLELDSNITGTVHLKIEIAQSGGGTTWETEYSGQVGIQDWGEELYYVQIQNYFPDHDDFVYGETYRVIWNGYPYICDVQEQMDYYGSGSYYCIGNATLGGGSTGNNEPFFAQRWGSDLMFATTDSSGTFTLTIEKQVGGGGGGSVLVPKTIVANGTYDPADDNADGYSEVTVALPSGTAGTPTATKGSVSNHSVSVTPSVTNTGGVISGGTLTGTPVTVSASELVSGSETKTSNGTYDVTNLAQLIVNVSSGSGIGTLLNTTSIGTVSTTSTNAGNTNVSLSVSNINNYDLLIVETSVDTVTNNRHTATVGVIFLTASSAVGTKNGATIATAKWNSKASSNGTTTTNVSTTAYGIYPNSCSISNGTATIPMYRRYNSTSTGTINGTYTARVYGVNLYDLIGG